MGFKELTSLDADVVIAIGGKDKKTGKPNAKSIEGYYLGKKQIEDRKKKSGVSYIYVFQTANGNTGVWGKTDLDKKMQSAVPGTMMRITSNGTRPTPNGDMYVFKVEADTENTIEVSAASEAPSYSETSVDDEGTGPNDEDEDFEEEAPIAARSVPSKESQDRVRSLLNRKN